MPRSAVHLWCEYFLSLETSLKTELLQKMWNVLLSEEQTAVIMDLQQFIALSLQEDLNAVVADCRNVNPDDDANDINNSN